MSDAATAKLQGSLTARDGEIIVAALQCVKGGDIQIDYAALCNRLGFKTEASARTAWCGVKRKLFNPTDEPATTPKAKTPRKPKDTNSTTPKSGKGASKAEAASKDGSQDSGDGLGNDPAAPTADSDVNQSEEAPATPKTPTTPKKRSRKSKAEKEAEAAANGEAAAAEGDDEKKPPKKRRTPAKKKGTEGENNGENEGETKTTPVKGKKAPAARKTAAPATDKAPAPAGPGEGEAVVLEVANVKKEEDDLVSGEADGALLAAGTANATKRVTTAADGGVHDTVNTVAQVIAAEATKAMADAAGDY
ncbi:uncharacterized protein PV07_05484 [Cladophialophora immunda]|uniref:Uncharacterized protein n=1 Tax=Cladophialophora immunda TaxID=569365 RepID=A0A0D1ZNY2_9EURO|nr:uncharacterized protein PV07_05484 [Cladophialophora immunda]KIW29691.1 hypothetical protein PV07_05484 [Cladophialophora immunda]OQU94775.1 hypothetical protein CLAIMM_01076 [Cladophialophora immunda]